MNREDIIRMARKAGWTGIYSEWSSPTERKSINVPVVIEQIEIFAALVAAAEREKVAKWMIQRSYATGHGDTTEDLLAELDWQIKERIDIEREACAQVVEQAGMDGYGTIAAALLIRERGAP